MEHSVEQPMFTIIVFGAPGHGKSTGIKLLADGRLDGPNKNKFKSGDSVESGLTKEIVYHEGFALNNEALRKYIKIFDTPGIGDWNLRAEKIVAEVKDKITSDEKIDCLLLFANSAEPRLLMQQILCLKIMGSIFKNFNPENVICVFTKCDLMKPNYHSEEYETFDDYLKAKL